MVHDLSFVSLLFDLNGDLLSFTHSPVTWTFSDADSLRFQEVLLNPLKPTHCHPSMYISPHPLTTRDMVATKIPALASSSSSSSTLLLFFRRPPVPILDTLATTPRSPSHLDLQPHIHQAPPTPSSPRRIPVLDHTHRHRHRHRHVHLLSPTWTSGFRATRDLIPVRPWRPAAS